VYALYTDVGTRSLSFRQAFSHRGEHKTVWPQKVPVLLYHYIEYVSDRGDTIRQSLDTPPHIFEKQLETLTTAGYTFMTMGELGDMFDGKKALPDKTVILTFDDGYRDFYTDAYPLLKKYRAKGTQYVITGYIGYKNYMTPKEIQDIAGEGIVELGAHTLHHVNLNASPPEEVVQEIVGSKNELEKLIGKPVVSFAYPNGFSNASIENAVKGAGFSTAVGTKHGDMQSPSERYQVVRIRPGAAVGEELLTRL
jgi:peptidoglycan/xylan/chitin deacetylase (PgdA/CDA1 family)